MITWENNLQLAHCKCRYIVTHSHPCRFKSVQFHISIHMNRVLGDIATWAFHPVNVSQLFKFKLKKTSILWRQHQMLWDWLLQPVNHKLPITYYYLLLDWQNGKKINIKSASGSFHSKRQTNHPDVQVVNHLSV